MSFGYQSQAPSQPLSIGARTEEVRPLIILVDDDDHFREGLLELMLSADLDAIGFSSTEALLKAELEDRPGCLIVDVRMPGVSGLDLQRRLAETGNEKPVVFLTGHGDIPMSVQAMKAGAIDFLTKPVRERALLDAISAGIDRDIKQRAQARILQDYVSRIQKLTARERQVFLSVVAGRQNKQIAFDLGIKQITVKLHRSNVMRKMQVTSAGELIRVWEALPSATHEKLPV